MTNQLRDKKYSILLSTVEDERGGGVGIVHKSSFLIKSLFKEFHSRNLYLARLSSVTSDPLLLLCIYLPPDTERRKTVLSALSRLLEFIKERYKSFSILAFGDLNVDLVYKPFAPESIRFSTLMKMIGLKVHYQDNTTATTRRQGEHSSYLDYFMSVGTSIHSVRPTI